MTMAKRYTDTSPETLIESELTAGVKAQGGMCIKFAPITAGVPDRIVILPGGRIYFIELKKPGGKVRAIQTVIHRKFALRGVNVVILFSREDVFKWLKRISLR